MTTLALTFAPTTRAMLERLAWWTVDGRFPDEHIPAALRILIPNADPAAALQLYGDLVEAVTLEHSWESGYLAWSDIVPDAAGRDRDEQASDRVHATVTLALDDLLAAEDTAGKRAA